MENFAGLRAARSNSAPATVPVRPSESTPAQVPVSAPRAVPTQSVSLPLEQAEDLVAARLRKSRKVVFVAGAGISCNAGIPDFRSDGGLYNLVKQRFPTSLVRGQDLFDVISFKDAKSRAVFYSFIAELRAAALRAEPTATHRFLRFLKESNKLLRVYTQNIDGLEERAGLGGRDLVQLHGDLDRLKCQFCGEKSTWDAANTELMLSGEAPLCEACQTRSTVRQAGGKRATTVGTLRPDIVLYGEDHPSGDEIAAELRRDCARRTTDLLVVAGTSLKVHGLRQLVKALAAAVHRNGGIAVLVNKTQVAASEWGDVFDHQITTDVDEWVQGLKTRIPQFFARQSRIRVKPRTKAKPAAKVDKTGASVKIETQLGVSSGAERNETVKSESNDADKLITKRIEATDAERPETVKTGTTERSAPNQSSRDAKCEPQFQTHAPQLKHKPQACSQHGPQYGPQLQFGMLSAQEPNFIPQSISPSSPFGSQFQSHFGPLRPQFETKLEPEFGPRF